MTARTPFGESPTRRNRHIASSCFRMAPKSWRVRRAHLMAAAVLLLGGCTVGPKYVQPTTEIPADFKEAGNWKAAQPSDAIAKGKWWEIYGDPQLNSLEEQVTVSNQTLKAAQAQFLEARAAVRVSRANLYPTATGSLAISRVGQSSNRALSSSTTPRDYNDFL